MSETAPRHSAAEKLTGETYDTRERVHDTDDTGGVLVVIETLETRADSFELTDGVTVAQFNQTHPASDHVVLCVYERQLDAAYPDWREVPKRELRENYAPGHRSSIQALPSSRVDRYTAGNWTETPDAHHCENCDSSLASATDWLEHIARDCPEVERDE